MILDAEGVKRLEQLKHNEDLLFKVIEYVECKLDLGYFEELNMFRKIGFTEDDLEYLGIRDYDIEHDFLIDDCWRNMFDYIHNTKDEDLKVHYDWYKVEYGDKTDLCNTMFESYCNSYDDKKLVEEINKLIGAE